MNAVPEYPFFYCRTIKRPFRKAEVVVEVIDNRNVLLYEVEELDTNEYGYSEWRDGVLVDGEGRPLQAEVDIARGIAEVSFGAESVDENGQRLIEAARAAGLWPPKAFNQI